MIRPAIQPEELAVGYWPRAARWNGLEPATNVQDFREQFLRRPWVECYGRSSMSRIAGMAGISVETLARRHTLMPHIYSLASADSPEWTAPGTVEERLSKSALLRVSAKLCPTCVNEDLGFHGFSIWRREHHLPGAWWCLKHGAPLASIPGSGVVSMIRSPSFQLRKSRSGGLVDLAVTECSPSIRRALEIQSNMLDLNAPLSRAGLQLVARERARELGLRLIRNDAGPSLSEVIRDQFCEDWLLKVCPSAVTARHGQSASHLIDSVLGSNTKVGIVALAVAFAALWESTDDALAAMTSSRKQYVPTRVRIARPNDSTIIASYQNHLGCLTEMLADLQICLPALKFRLAKLGLPNLYGRRKMALAAVLLDGDPEREASRNWGVPVADLRFEDPSIIRLLQGVLRRLMAIEPSDSRLTKQKVAITENHEPARHRQTKCSLAPLNLPTSSIDSDRRRQATARWCQPTAHRRQVAAQWRQPTAHF